MGKDLTKLSCSQKMSRFFGKGLKLLYDNSFFEELYPTIRQQKPGIDLYVYIATVEFVLCLFILLWYTKMKAESSSIAQQFSSN